MPWALDQERNSRQTKSSPWSSPTAENSDSPHNSISDFEMTNSSENTAVLQQQQQQQQQQQGDYINFSPPSSVSPLPALSYTLSSTNAPQYMVYYSSLVPVNQSMNTNMYLPPQSTTHSAYGHNMQPVETYTGCYVPQSHVYIGPHFQSPAASSYPSPYYIAPPNANNDSNTIRTDNCHNSVSSMVATMDSNNDATTSS